MRCTDWKNERAQKFTYTFIYVPHPSRINGTSRGLLSVLIQFAEIVYDSGAPRVACDLLLHLLSLLQRWWWRWWYCGWSTTILNPNTRAQFITAIIFHHPLGYARNKPSRCCITSAQFHLSVAMEQFPVFASDQQNSLVNNEQDDMRKEGRQGMTTVQLQLMDTLRNC